MSVDALAIETSAMVGNYSADYAAKVTAIVPVATELVNRLSEPSSRFDTVLYAEQTATPDRVFMQVGIVACNGAESTTISDSQLIAHRQALHDAVAYLMERPE